MGVDSSQVEQEGVELFPGARKLGLHQYIASYTTVLVQFCSQSLHDICISSNSAHRVFLQDLYPAGS